MPKNLTHTWPAAAASILPIFALVVDFACEGLLRCDIEMGGKVSKTGVVICDRSELHNGFARVNSHYEVIPCHFPPPHTFLLRSWPCGLVAAFWGISRVKVFFGVILKWVARLDL